jgi:hypothetical protein
MTIKKKDNWKSFSSFLLFALTVIIIGPLPIVIAIRLANYFQVPLYAGLRAFLNLIGFMLAYLIGVKLFGVGKPRRLFTNLRDGVVISISWLLFFLMAFSAFDIKDSPPYLCMFSFPIAIFVAISFAYFLGTEELKQKIRKFFKGFKKKRSRKRETGATNDKSIDS